MKFVLLSFIIMLQGASFKDVQLKQSRVKVAFQQKEKIVRQYFLDKKLNYASFEVFIRGFKKEMELEIWIKQKDQAKYTLLHTYDFCTVSGVLGPKRKEADLQIPEGVYHINHFNPESNFHLSLGLNYPNASDKILSDKQHPGGAIYIHGNCATIGCIPITDDKIKELYVILVEARNNGQDKIPVHIFPARLSDEGMASLEKIVSQHDAFWKNLRIVYSDFEQTKKLRPVKVNKKGEYQF